jgi:hypothetical protein
LAAYGDIIAAALALLSLLLTHAVIFRILLQPQNQPATQQIHSPA